MFGRIYVILNIVEYYQVIVLQQIYTKLNKMLFKEANLKPGFYCMWYLSVWSKFDCRKVWQYWTEERRMITTWASIESGIDLTSCSILLWFDLYILACYLWSTHLNIIREELLQGQEKIVTCIPILIRHRSSNKYHKVAKTQTNMYPLVTTQ